MSADDAAARAMDALRRLVSALRTSGAAASGELGMSVAQLFALRMVGAHPGISMGELAAHTLTSPAAVSEVVSRLEQREFLHRSVSPDDGRRAVLELSPQGRALLDRIGETLPERLISALAAMSPETRHTVALSLEHWVAGAGLAGVSPHMFGEDQGSSEARPTVASRRRHQPAASE